MHTYLQVTGNNLIYNPYNPSDAFVLHLLRTEDATAVFFCQVTEPLTQFQDTETSGV